jgi:hypothetical protein
MTASYSKLLAPLVPMASEKKQAYHFLTERHIQAVWFEQKYFTALTTTTGAAIEVLSPGLWNLEAGPDFLRAHLKIGEREYFGDIEIHLHDGSWHQHQHHRDPRYNQVILHLSLWAPKQPIAIYTSLGDTPQQVHLSSFLTIPLKRLVQLIDLDLYPYKKFLGSGRCAQELFNQLPPQEISHFFEKAADWRLKRKHNFLHAHLPEPSMHLAAGIAMALGYKNNSDQFLALYLHMQTEEFASEEAALAWLLGSCGFFAESFVTKWGGSTYYGTLQELYTQSSQGAELSPPVQLHLNQIRPLNHPVRRLVVLAKLGRDKTIAALTPKIYASWNEGWQKGVQSGKWKELLDAFKALLPNYQAPYWNSHYLFEEQERTPYLPLMGDDLKREIVVNLILPLLAEQIAKQGLHPEINAFQMLYRSLPPSKASKRKYLIHRFFGNSPLGALLNNAYSEQGAYQLHYDFCVHFEASCEGCPFVERYKRLNSTPLLTSK